MWNQTNRKSKTNIETFQLNVGSPFSVHYSFIFFIYHIYHPFTRKQIVSLCFGWYVRTRLGVAISSSTFNSANMIFKIVHEEPSYCLAVSLADGTIYYLCDAHCLRVLLSLGRKIVSLIFLAFIQQISHD